MAAAGFGILKRALATVLAIAAFGTVLLIVNDTGVLVMKQSSQGYAEGPNANFSFRTVRCHYFVGTGILSITSDTTSAEEVGCAWIKKAS